RASGRTHAPVVTAASPPRPRHGHTAAAAPPCACGRATGPSPFRQTSPRAADPPAPSGSTLAKSSLVRWPVVCSSCPHLHRRHTLQIFNPALALNAFSWNARSLHPHLATVRLSGRRLLGVGHRRQTHTATGAIHSVCSPRTQPQSAAPLAILQLDLDFLAFHPAHEVHDCLSV